MNENQRGTEEALIERLSDRVTLIVLIATSFVIVGVAGLIAILSSALWALLTFLFLAGVTFYGLRWVNKVRVR